MMLVPRDTPGVRVVRTVTTLGYPEYPFGEPEIDRRGQTPDQGSVPSSLPRISSGGSDLR
jgi:hypothetical protein